MKFLSTNGAIYKVDLRPSRWPRRDKETSKSNFQFRVGSVIANVWPQEIILEEFYIPRDRLYIDFFLPRKKIAVEAHGSQHYKYNEFFHGSIENFKLSQARDNKKKLWCSINELRLIVVREEDSEEQIITKLLSD